MHPKMILWLSWLVAATVSADMNHYPLDFVPPSPPQTHMNGGLLELEPDLNSLLQPRQVCAAPRGQCPNTGSCCLPGQKCCNSGICGLETEGQCCRQGQCSNTDGYPVCCQDSFCIATNAECCTTPGWSCPAPFLCGIVTYYWNNVPINSFPACCDSPQCTAWLDGTTVTSFQTTTANVVNTRTVTSVIADTTPASRTTQAATDLVTTGIASLRLYTTWIVWSYRSQFYTLRTIGGTRTSRTVTTVYTTTTISVSATASADAELSFLSSSMALIEPTDISVPLTPTSGALIQGACTTSTRVQMSEVVCQTLTADGALFTASGTGNSEVRSAAFSVGPGALTIYLLSALSCLMALV